MHREVSNVYMHQFLTDGIIYSSYKRNMVITLEAAKQCIEDRKVLCNNSALPLLVDARSVCKMTREARNYFGSAAGYEFLSAAAIVSDSILSTFIANFLIQVNLKKTPIPVKIFSSKREAINWLTRYK
ncbi:hypothetical protein N9R81_02615 [Flavobacteriales bacterium]|nr:hypothetical protein [Flavobacteriales bacterium]